MSESTTPRIYRSTKPKTNVQFIAGPTSLPSGEGRMCVYLSRDGGAYYTALFVCALKEATLQTGLVFQPFLNINGVTISATPDSIIYRGTRYRLNSSATMGTPIARPVPKVIDWLNTVSGQLVIVIDLLSGRRVVYLNSRALYFISGSHEIDGSGAVCSTYSYMEQNMLDGHSLTVVTSPDDPTNQLMAFDNRPVERLNPARYQMELPRPEDFRE
jgi:hypothetical protein